jgi:hypothetical protein
MVRGAVVADEPVTTGAGAALATDTASANPATPAHNIDLPMNFPCVQRRDWKPGVCPSWACDESTAAKNGAASQ